MNETTVRRTLKNSPQDPVSLGHHAALDEERENIIIAYIHERNGQCQTLTRKEPLQFVKENYGHMLTKGWVHAFLGCHRDDVHVYRSLPQEDITFVIPREYLEQNIQTMKDIIYGNVFEFVFNLDEVESADWEDRKPKEVTIPISVQEENIYHSISHKFKHSSLLACVSVASDSLTPFVMSAAPIPELLWLHSLRPDEDALMRRPVRPIH
jgi:hypothetical protein